MNHFLLTRFNLKVASWNKTRSGHKVLTEEWLEHRFYLFETFTLSSILNQTSKNFKWLIFFDINTPEKYRTRAKINFEKYDFIEIFYIDGIESLMPTLKIFFDQESYHNRKLITTRLDNDDALHKNFTATVQKHFKDNTGVLDFENGYQGVLYSGNTLDVRKYHHKFNQFISFAEISEKPITVLGKMHTDFKTFSPQKIDRKNRYWLEIIHDMNKINNSKSNLYSDLKIDVHDFGINESVLKTVAWNTLFFRNIGVYYRLKLNALKRTIKSLIHG